MAPQLAATLDPAPNSMRVSRKVPVGTRLRSRVPATSANLGPAFDVAGVALAYYDEITIEVTEGGLAIDIEGEGADSLPRDERHLLAHVLHVRLAQRDAPAPGLKLDCRNTIPQGRGLGSSSAATVAGLLAAEVLARIAHEEPVSGFYCQLPATDGQADADEAVNQRLALLPIAAAIEGHPDNVAACLLGGFTLAWGSGAEVNALRLNPAALVQAAVYVAEAELKTTAARTLLPESVPFGDAVTNLSRTAILTQALTTRPDLLWLATQDRLHQNARGQAMPASLELVETLRDKGFAAAISGAGPCVVVLGEDLAAAELPEVAGFERVFMPLDRVGAAVTIDTN